MPATNATMKSDLSDKEKDLFAEVIGGNISSVQSLLNDKDVRVNSTDDQGMTLLQHAAYKGNYEMCNLLLERGGDVNNDHEHKYTALMFATLSGKVDVVNLLLSAGARIDDINSLKRNAAQMAAFVGNHHCVSAINNYVPRASIDYYTQLRGLETEPKLPMHLAEHTHRLALDVNMHPVHVALMLAQKSPVLLVDGLRVSKVFELLSEREMKKKETNEVLGLKYHVLGFILRSCANHFSKEKEQGKESSLDGLLRSWMKGRPADGFQENLEKFLRQAMRDFPYAQSSLFEQLIRTLSAVQIGEEPTTFQLINSTINGQRATEEEELNKICSTCFERVPAAKKCSACKSVRYCDQTCQKLHWNIHKRNCAKLAKDSREVVEETAEEMEKLAVAEGK